MATTSTILMVGKTLGRGGNGGYNGRSRAGVVATAALGFTLLIGGTFGLARQAGPAASAPAARPAATEWSDDVQRWCSETPGVFACATAEWSDDVQRWCSETPGVFACVTPRVRRP